MPDPPGSIEEENELRHFLKLARPEWSRPRRRGGSDVNRVIDKLKSIGVTDPLTLIEYIDHNSLNEELSRNGHGRLSKEALDSIRKQSGFIKNIENVDITPTVRQTGPFAPAPQLLARKKLVTAFHLKTLLVNEAASAGGFSPCRAARTTDEFFPEPEAERYFIDNSFYGEGDIGDQVPVKLRGPKTPGGNSSKKKREHGGGHTKSPSAGNTDSKDEELQLLKDIEALAVVDQRLQLQEGQATIALSDLGDSMFSNPKSPACARRASSSAMTELQKAKTSPPLGTSGRLAWTGDALEGSERRAASQPQGRIPRPGTSGSWCGASTAEHRATIVMAETASSVDKSRSSRAKATTRKEVSVDEVQELLQAGAEMKRSYSESCWSPARYKSPDDQGEEILKEQASRAELARFVRQLKTQKHPLPMRSHVARNIHSRLQQEPPFATQALNIQQQCLNVKKHLAAMVNARRELASLRSRVKDTAEDEEEDDKKDKGEQLSLGFGKGASAQGRRSSMGQSAEDGGEEMRRSSLAPDLSASLSQSFGRRTSTT
eukprot:TRINITY_DN74273_c0_g1_i1.p1 TRINITY_DN74273_c0_g1~~TRINITY_DN74273_c0_g1_i1.p1  ORF type:complete len:546 (-),score=135.32 TRINITY_DN74273_c0_g1_i1:258-1895(-)